MSIEIYKEGEINNPLIAIEVIDERVWRDNDNHIITLNCEWFVDKKLYDVKILQGTNCIISFDQVLAIKNGKIMFKIDALQEKSFQTGNSKHKTFKVEVCESNNKTIKYESSLFFRRKKMKSAKGQIITLTNSASNSIPISDDLSNNRDSIKLTNSLILPKKTNNLNNHNCQARSLEPLKNNSFLSSDSDEIMEFESPSIKSSIIRNDENLSLNTNNSLKVNEFKIYKEYLEEIDAFSIIINTSDIPKESEKLEEKIYFARSDSKLATNHTLRLLKQKYKVRYIASINFKDERDKKTRSENSVLNFNPKQSLIKLLKNGIKSKMTKYELVYIGHSNSGLKENTFWAIDKESMERIGFDNLLKDIGDFSNIKKPEKLSKRYAQNFSTSIPSIKLKGNEYICIDDDKTLDSKYEFTDGIGMIRIKIAEEISQVLELSYTSYIFQIRCCGFKGVLVAFNDEIFNKYLKMQNVEKGTRTSAINVIFRKSQKKYEAIEKEIMLNIVNWVNSTEKFPPASLNSEFLMILDGLDKDGNLGIRDYIVGLFKNSLQDISESTNDPVKAYSKLFFGYDISEFSVKFSSILLACEGKLSESLDYKTHQTIKNQIMKQHLIPSICDRKYNISIENSFYLIGIIDESDTLQEGEVFVSFRDSNGGIQYLDNKDVLVSKTPCYCLSEMRVVKTKNVPYLNHLVNCIAFSKKGNRPLPNCLSGGDLDGDLYFVTFNEIFCRFKNYPPIEYPTDTTIVKNSFNNASKHEIIIESVVNAVLGKQVAGIWHYHLTCLYDQDRGNMTKQNYIEGALEFNKYIDGLSSKEAPFTRKPNWYITRKEFNPNDLEQLNSIIKEKKLSDDIIDSNKISLIQYLVRLASKTYREILESSNYNNNSKIEQFFTDEDENILLRDNRIDLEIVKNELTDNNIDLLSYNDLKTFDFLPPLSDRQNKKKETEMFIGAVEKMLNHQTSLKKRSEDVKRKEEFRKFVINYTYECEMNIRLPDSIKNSIHNPTGLFIQSRIYNIYKNIMNNHKDSSFIAWEFYDILCSLKNYCRYKKNEKLSNEFYSSMPYTIPFEFSKAFSIARLEKLS